MVAMEGLVYCAFLYNINYRFFEIFHRNQGVAALCVQGFPHAFEGFSSGGKSQAGQGTIGELDANAEVRFIFWRTCRHHFTGEGLFKTNHGQRQVSPVTQIAKNAAAFFIAVIPVVIGNLVADDEPAQRNGAGLTAKRHANTAEVFASGAIEAKKYLNAGVIPLRFKKPFQLVFADDVGLFDMNAFSSIHALYGVFRVRRMVGSDEHQADGWIGDDLFNAGGGVSAAKITAQRPRGGGVYVAGCFQEVF